MSYLDFSSSNANSSCIAGWSAEDWRSEVQRLTALNREMTRALKNQQFADSASCRLDFPLNEVDLLTENWDLKQSIGRIRYGKPSRSLEDRDTINRLETENQDLRNIVGKLRYQCGQPSSSASKEQILPTTSGPAGSPPTVSEPLLKTLDSMNLTQYWTSLMNEDDEELDAMKESASDLLQLIGLRREALKNLTGVNSSIAAQKMQATLQKSVEKIVGLMERIHNHQESAEALAADIEARLQELRKKLENNWGKIFEPEENAKEDASKMFENDKKSLNAGQSRLTQLL